MDPEGYAGKARRRSGKVSAEQAGADALVLKGREYSDAYLWGLVIVECAALKRGNKQSAKDASGNRTVLGDGQKTKIARSRSPILHIGCDEWFRQHRPGPS